MQPRLAFTPPPSPRFDGATYDPAVDQVRLTGQLARIFAVIQDGRWRTLTELADQAQAPPASVSAQLRHLRKARFGGYTIERRSRGDRRQGLYEYRLQSAGQ